MNKNPPHKVCDFAGTPDGYKAMFAQVQSVHSANPNKMEVIMNKSRHRSYRKPILVAVIIAVIAALSFSAYALVSLLSPAEVARELGQDALAEAFENGNGTVINETITSEGYVFTLMGMTSGENLLKYYSDVDADKTNLVVSIRREDGTPLDIMEGFAGQFGSSVLFSGYKPWQLNSIMLGAGGSAFDRDGVLYLVLEIDADIEMFADRTVNYAIWAMGDGFGFAPSAELFAMAEDGTIAFADGLPIAHAMFTLPLDASKADPARVARVLEERGVSLECVQSEDMLSVTLSDAQGGADEVFIFSADDDLAEARERALGKYGNGIYMESAPNP